jgi:alginate O-acetyltransferase complex protein AlgJ
VQKNLSTSSFKSLPTAFLMALPVCLFLRFGDLFLPPQTFTHRLWEALIVHREHGILPGPFYPNQMQRMQEQGDLAPYTPLAVKKTVFWETDSHGYRTHENPSPAAIVVVGDSTVLGTGLDQEETLAAVLMTKLQKTVYPYAPYYTMTPYLSDPRFQGTSPKTVIFTMMEWALPDLLQKPAPAEREKNPSLESFLKKILPPAQYQQLAILRDRAGKMSLMRFLEARLRGFVKSRLAKTPFETAPFQSNRMVFAKAKAGHADISLEKVKPILEIIRAYEKEMRARGAEFYFMPVPNKATIYADLLPRRPRPVFFETLLREARSAGIPLIDLKTPYDAAAARGELLYHLDDTHWNHLGVRLAAETAEKVIGKKHE